MSAAEDNSLKADETLEMAGFVGLSDEALVIAKDCHDVNDFGDLLIEKLLLKDAVRWYAHAIPKDKAVIWCSECVEKDVRLLENPSQQSAFDSAVVWANDPTDANRREAARLAELAKLEGIGGALAAAVAWSGGSLAPVDQPVVPPDDRLTGRGVYIAFLLASHLGKPSETTSRLQSYLSRLPKPK